MGFLDTLFGGGAEQQAAQQDIQAAGAYQNQALPALQTGYNTGSGAINTAVAGYQPLAQLGQTYSGGAPTYMAALGIGTPQQIAQAQSTFQNTPGFSAMLANAAQAVARQRAVGGMGASGNADIDAMMAAAGITGQQYQNWVSNLQNAGQMGIGATAGAAQGQGQQYDALANLASQYAQNQANVYGNVMNTTVGANNLAAAGKAAGAKNLLGLGESLLSDVATLGTGGLSGGISGLFGGGGMSNLFGGSPSYGGGSMFSGDAYGGSSYNPLPGLDPNDYAGGF